MKIATWNVNSIRARIENIKKYLKLSSPDIVLLQEIKTENQNYPYKDLEELGYISYVHGQKSYNGVSILSKKKINEISKDLPGDKKKQSRIISGELDFRYFFMFSILALIELTFHVAIFIKMKKIFHNHKKI